MVSLRRECYGVEVHCATKTVLLDLANLNTLKKWAHRMTQNWHETISWPVWNWWLQTAFTSNKIIEKAVNSAVLNYKNQFLVLKINWKNRGMYSSVRGDYKNSRQLKNMGKIYWN